MSSFPREAGKLALRPVPPHPGRLTAFEPPGGPEGQDTAYGPEGQDTAYGPEGCGWMRGNEFIMYISGGKDWKIKNRRMVSEV